MYLVGKKRKKGGGRAINFPLGESPMITQPHARRVLASNDVATAGLYLVFCTEVQGCICSWCKISMLYHTNEAAQSTQQQLL